MAPCTHPPQSGRAGVLSLTKTLLWVLCASFGSDCNDYGIVIVFVAVDCVFVRLAECFELRIKHFEGGEGRWEGEQTKSSADDD